MEMDSQTSSNVSYAGERIIQTGSSIEFSIGVIGDPALAGEIGWMQRSVTSTSSPTRRTAPLGPAQAYCPNTGLSGNGQSSSAAKEVLVEKTHEGTVR